MKGMTNKVGRKAKLVRRIHMRIPEPMYKQIMWAAKESNMKSTDYLEEAVRYMKLKPLKQMEHDYAAELYDAQMNAEEADRLSEEGCRLLGTVILKYAGEEAYSKWYYETQTNGESPDPDYKEV